MSATATASADVTVAPRWAPGRQPALYGDVERLVEQWQDLRRRGKDNPEVDLAIARYPGETPDALINAEPPKALSRMLSPVTLSVPVGVLDLQDAVW
jgi:hypothetical protein